MLNHSSMNFFHTVENKLKRMEKCFLQSFLVKGREWEWRNGRNGMVLLTRERKKEWDEMRLNTVITYSFHQKLWRKLKWMQCNIKPDNGLVHVTCINNIKGMICGMKVGKSPGLDYALDFLSLKYPHPILYMKDIIRLARVTGNVES